MTAHVSTEAPSLCDSNPEAPAALVKLVDSMLAKDPAQRPQTPAEVAERLSQLARGADLAGLIGAGLSATGPPQQLDSTTASAASPSTQPWLRRPVPVFTAIAAGVVGLFVGLFGGWLIKIKHPDGTQIAVEAPAGSEITLEAVDAPTGAAAAAGIDGQPTQAGETAAAEASGSALLQFAVLPDESEASVMLRQRNDVPPSEQQQPLPPGSGIFYPVGEDVEVPMSVTHKGVRYQLVKDSPESLITWDQIRGHILTAMTRGGQQGTTIELSFDESLAERMRVLTRNNLNRRLAIIFNGRIVSAPRILSEIGSQAMITGVFSSEEVRFLMQSIDGGLVVPMRGSANATINEAAMGPAQPLQGLWKVDTSIVDQPITPPDGLVVAFDDARFYVVLQGEIEQVGTYTLDEPDKDGSGKMTLVGQFVESPTEQTATYRFLPDGRLQIDIAAGAAGKSPSGSLAAGPTQTITCARIGDLPSDVSSAEFKFIMDSFSDGTKQDRALAQSVFVITQIKQVGVDAYLSATTRVKAAANASKTRMHLKMIGIAFHNFNDVYKKLPGSANHKEGSTGVPKDAKIFPFSWRVAILPFIEQKELFEQYRFDQPWDSEANLKLLDKMPETYRSPFASQDQPSGHTNYQGFVSDASALAKDGGLSFRDLRDGTSNTLLLVETKSSVPWTKPQDIEGEPEYFDDQPLTFLMADGSVRTMNPIDKEELAKMITRDGGEVVRP